MLKNRRMLAIAPVNDRGGGVGDIDLFRFFVDSFVFNDIEVFPDGTVFIF